jgi:DNA primase
VAQDDLTALKPEVDLRALIPATEQRRAFARGYVSDMCPFHLDNSPSFQIYPDGWKCFAQCGSADVFDYLIRVEGLSLREAIERVREMPRPLGLSGRAFRLGRTVNLQVRLGRH